MFTKLLRHSLFALGILVATSVSLPVQAQPALYVEGSHYTVLADNPLSRAQASAAVPLVTEIFWYGCAHCHAFDPLLAAWVNAKGATISFTRIPTVWNGNTESHARLFAAATDLGIHAQVHEKIFTEIHDKRNFLLDEKSQLAFLLASGIANAEAQKALDSFSVDSQVRKAETLQRELNVPSIPAMIVGGKYMVNIDGPVRTHADMLKVVDYLLGKVASG